MYTKHSINIPLFLLGVFSLTEIRLVGSAAISEWFIFVVAPFVFIKNYDLLKRDGFMPLLWLAIAVSVSNFISCLVNKVEWDFALRGMATNYSIFAIPVVMHNFLRKDLSGLKWFFVGGAISALISMFVFQKGSEIGLADRMGVEASEAILGNEFLWTARIGGWLSLPINAFYYSTPLVYSIFEPFLFSLYFLLASASGRSAALVGMCSSILILIGGKRRKNMARIKKHFFAMVAIAVVGFTIIKIGYVYTAKSGILGEEAQRKYVMQTRGSDSALSIIMGGRSDFFMGLVAALEHPIWGYGPWPVDKDGFAERFFYEHADYEEILVHERMKILAAQNGVIRQGWIPTHSHLIGFWVWYGLAGLIFWLYVLRLIFQVIRYWMNAIPQWYGYLCVMLPSFVWAIFFSPYGRRVGTMTGVVCLLFVRAVATGKMRLPLSMLIEAEKYDNK